MLNYWNSCASLLINTGALVTLVSKYIGYASVTETLNTYSHMFKSDLDNISNLLDKITKDAIREVVIIKAFAKSYFTRV